MWRVTLALVSAILAGGCGEGDDDTSWPRADAAPPYLAVCAPATTAVAESYCNGVEVDRPVGLDPLDPRAVDPSMTTWVRAQIGHSSNILDYFYTTRATILVTRRSDGRGLASLVDEPMKLDTYLGAHLITSAVSFTVCSEFTKAGTVMDVTVKAWTDWFTLERAFEMTIDCMGDATCLAMCS